MHERIRRLTTITPLLLPLAVLVQSAPPPSTVPTSLTVKWRHDAGKPLHATPAADTNRLFVADETGVVTALDRASRQTLWKSAAAGDVSAGLLITAGHLIVADEDGLVRAFLPADGKEAWRFSTGGKILSRPASSQDTLYVGSYDQHLYALDVATGKLKWKLKTGAQVHASPTLAGDTILIAGCDADIRAVDADAGQEKWSLDAGDPIAAAPQVNQGVVCVGTLKGERIAADLATGKVLWRSTDDHTRGEPIMAVAAISPGRVTFLTQGGVAATHALADGKFTGAALLKGRFTSDPVNWQTHTWYTAEEGRLLGPAGQPAFTASGATKAAPLPLGDQLILVDESGMIWGIGQ